MIWHSSLLLPFSVALSTSCALSSIQFLLSSRALLLTSLSLVLYSSLSLFFHPFDLAPSSCILSAVLILTSPCVTPYPWFTLSFRDIYGLLSTSRYTSISWSCSSSGSSMSSSVWNLFFTSTLNCSALWSVVTLSFYGVFLPSALPRLLPDLSPYQVIITVYIRPAHASPWSPTLMVSCIYWPWHNLSDWLFYHQVISVWPMMEYRSGYHKPIDQCCTTHITLSPLSFIVPMP